MAGHSSESAGHPKAELATMERRRRRLKCKEAVLADILGFWEIDD